VLIVLTAQLYIIMYVLMFAAAVKLRYSQPKVKRPYVVPGGKFGIWLVSGIGILSCLVAFIFGFIPPPQFNNALLVFIGFLLLSIIITCAIPFVILHFRKEEWKS
jgi:amino acid transporter